MKSKLLSTLLLLSLVTQITMGNAWGANDALDAKTVKQQSISIPIAQDAVSRAVGYGPANIKIESTAHLVTITAIDITLNSDASKDRESEAAKMAAALENVISGKTEFTNVMIIHVDYVKPSNHKKTIKSYEFYKTPAGAFVIHKS
jgi:hypothetical protein